jgi:hypothetical protein
MEGGVSDNQDAYVVLGLVYFVVGAICAVLLGMVVSRLESIVYVLQAMLETMQ